MNKFSVYFAAVAVLTASTTNAVPVGNSLQIGGGGASGGISGSLSGIRDQISSAVTSAVQQIREGVAEVGYVIGQLGSGAGNSTGQQANSTSNGGVSLEQLQQIKTDVIQYLREITSNQSGVIRQRVDQAVRGIRTGLYDPFIQRVIAAQNVLSGSAGAASGLLSGGNSNSNVGQETSSSGGSEAATSVVAGDAGAGISAGGATVGGDASVGATVGGTVSSASSQTGNGGASGGSSGQSQTGNNLETIPSRIAASVLESIKAQKGTAEELFGKVRDSIIAIGNQVESAVAAAREAIGGDQQQGGNAEGSAGERGSANVGSSA